MEKQVGDAYYNVPLSEFCGEEFDLLPPLNFIRTPKGRKVAVPVPKITHTITPPKAPEVKKTKEDEEETECEDESITDNESEKSKDDEHPEESFEENTSRKKKKKKKKNKKDKDVGLVNGLLNQKEKTPPLVAQPTTSTRLVGEG